MGAIENLANVIEWTKQNAQSSHGFSGPVSSPVWEPFETFTYDTWHKKQGDNGRWSRSGGGSLGGNVPYYYAGSNHHNGNYVNEIENVFNSLPYAWIDYPCYDGCEMFNITPFYSNYGSIFIHDNGSQYGDYSYSTGRFFDYLTPTPQTGNFNIIASGISGGINIPKTNYRGGTVKIAILNDGNEYGWCVYAVGPTGYHYIHQYTQVFTPEALSSLGSYSINENYEDSDVFGDGGVAQGLTGIFKMASDKITKPTKPSVGVSSSGFVNVYKIDPQSLVDLGKDLFSDVDIDFDECVMTSEEFTNFINTSLTLSGVTLASVPQEMIEQGCGQEITVGMSLASIFKLLKASVRNFFSSQLIKYVIDCHIIPCSPTHGNDERINIGYRQFSQVGKKLNEDYVDVTCGTLDLKGYYQNFLDAQTKLSLFLPFVGFVELSPQQFLMDGATIGVDYRFNVLDGSCIAYVSSNKIGGDTSIIGVYSGSSCVHLPITGENYSSMVSGMMQTIGGVASGIATGNPMLAGGSIVGGVSNMLSNMSGTQLGNNNFSCSASFMGIRKPYIVIERPIAQLPPRFFKDKGAMAQIVDKLSKFNGFTKCTDVQMPNDMPKSISDNIKSLLESGVIL